MSLTTRSFHCQGHPKISHAFYWTVGYQTDRLYNMNLCFFIHPFPQRSWPYQDHLPACTLHTFTVRQLRIREPATSSDREPSSQDIIEFRPSPRFCFYPRCRRWQLSSAASSTCSVLGFDYFSFGYYFLGFGSFSWLFILSCFWSAWLYALLCWYFAPTYQPLL